MKKILLFFILIIIVLVGLYFAAPAFKQVGAIADPIEAYENFVNDLFGISGGEAIVVDEPVDEGVVDQEDEVVEEEPIEEEPVDEEVIEEDPVEEVAGGPRPSVVDLAFYTDDKINFTYPSGFEVVEISDFALELRTGEGVLVATYDFFVNETDLDIAEFVQADNIVDYLAEADRVNLEISELSVGLEAFYLKDYPGFITQDVYLVRIPGYVIVIQVRNQKDMVRNHVAPTLEARL